MATLSGRTRSVIQASVAGLADALSQGLTGRLLSADSAFDLAGLIEAGGVLIVDVPPQYGAVSRLVTVGVKHLVQQAVRRRAVRPDSPLFGLVIDEFQSVVTRGDWNFASRSRESRGPLLVACQGVESLRAELGGDRAKDEVDALASNLGSKLGCNPTWPTATWVCEQIGKTRVRMTGGSTSAGGYASPLDLAMPQMPGQATGSFSEQMDLVLRPEELAGMRTGGPANGYLVDALLIQSGKRHDTGGPWTYATFDQRR